MVQYIVDTMDVQNLYFGLINLIIISFIFFVFYKYWFLRDPHRTIPEGGNIVSPADGKVIKITPFDSSTIEIKKGYFGKIQTLTKDVVKKGILISIFMSPMNVHINRSPIDGRIVSLKHTKGKFKRANSIRAINNEKNEIIIENDEIGKLKVIQIAGFLARRIVSFVEENTIVNKGQRIGLIKFGSQVVLIIPEIELCIKEGQKVKAGKTIIAHL